MLRASKIAPACLQIVQLDEEKNDFVCRGTFDHPYPPTKMLWAPEPLARERDLLATTGDYLRLWHVQPVGDGSGEVEVKLEALMNNVSGGSGSMVYYGVEACGACGLDPPLEHECPSFCCPRPPLAPTPPLNSAPPTPAEQEQRLLRAAHQFRLVQRRPLHHSHV